MKIVFFGATKLGFKCCKAIVENNLKDIEVCGIFTIPKVFNIKYKNQKTTAVNNVLFEDFSWFKKEYNIPVFEINQNIKDYTETIRGLEPDFILCIGWYYMIPKTVLQMVPKGAAGIHASLLPKYRGNAPLVWAMINGESETGLSFFYFDDGIDNGDIIAQEKIAVHENDTIKEVLEKVEKASVKVLIDNLPLIADGTAKRIQQNHDQATYFPKRTPADGEIDWSWGAQKIKNFIRAQTRPYPGAFTIINGKKVTIWDADISTIEDDRNYN